jgi:hypothetical protein
VTPDRRNDSVSLEIASRLIKVALMLGTALGWIVAALGAYSVVQLWTLERNGDWFIGQIEDYLQLGWVCIAVIVLIRAGQLAVAWAVLAPIEAKIQGVNLRDRTVAMELKVEFTAQFLLEAVGVLVLVAVPIAIAYFRHGYRL